MPTQIEANQAAYLDKINTFLEKLLETKESEQELLYQAARYAVLGDAKRIRPSLCISVASMLGASIDKALQPAAAIELVHCYSLIHDDLPAMDNDDFRRGKPTVHKAFPESIAILAGDYLLTFAFELLACAPHLDDPCKIRLIRLLSHCAGGEGMVGGQVRDINSENKQLNIEELKQLHQRKTGKLIEASILFGAILGEADATTYQKLKEIAEAFGLLFQIADDIIDVVDSRNKHGKAVSSDQANQKTTYVSLLGLEGALEEMNRLSVAIEAHLEQLSHPAAELKILLSSVSERCRCY